MPFNERGEIVRAPSRGSGSTQGSNERGEIIRPPRAGPNPPRGNNNGWCLIPAGTGGVVVVCALVAGFLFVVNNLLQPSTSTANSSAATSTSEVGIDNDPTAPVVDLATESLATERPPTTQRPTAITRSPTESAIQQVESEPSEWRIAFTSDHDGSDTIWTMDRDGARRQQLTSASAGLDDWHPEWCEGNRSILFERGDHSHGTETQMVFEVSVSSPDQAYPWAGLAEGLLVSGQPACSLSDNQVYFGGVGDHIDWRIFSSDGVHAAVFGPGYEKLGSVAVSGDGRVIAFSYRNVADGSGTFYLNMVSANNPNSAHSIHPAGVDGALAIGLNASGDQLVYACQYGNKSWQLCLSDDNGGNLYVPGLLIRDTDGKRGDISALAGSPTWSPDGRWVAFASNDDGDWDVYVWEVSTGQLQNLTDDWASNEMMPAWSK